MTCSGQHAEDLKQTWGLLPWWSIHHKIVNVAPVHVLEELLDEGILAGPPPYDSIIRVLKHEACTVMALLLQ